MASESSATAKGIEPQESSGTLRVVGTVLTSQTSTQTTISKVVRIEIKATVGVKLICWSGAPGSGTANITIDGPTNGKHKIDPRRLGGYRVEIR
ncbi:hypothetical protein BOTCAL_1571g00010 [Botryotinia calthae]|uniref:Uncharacterized protein n=1 Tax=Botryotinia calthae TaxID=38488 RepID=A0A4Y8CBE3_9HELO|nr:hypothetical protein BOTCAL_1571g00010 [Botryotinia calthae]